MSCAQLLEWDRGFFENFQEPDPALDIYHEQIEGRSCLLVTIGDSWTWGNGLGTTDHARRISDPNRVSMLYGQRLKDLIGSDWINIGFCSSANLWLVDVAQRFLHIVEQTKYEQIIVVVTLTDMTRDVGQEGLHPQAPGQFLKSIELYERDRFKTLAKLCNHPRIRLLVGRNFTSTFESNRNILKDCLIEPRWIDLSAQRWNEVELPTTCVGFRLPFNMSVQDKEWADREGAAQAQATMNFLKKCPLYVSHTGGHPGAENHQIWAEFLYSKLINKKVDQ